MFRYHVLSLIIGSLLDLKIGDPHGIPHPIVYIGRWIGKLDKKLLGDDPGKYSVKEQQIKGVELTAAVIAPVAAISAGILSASYAISPVVGVGVESALTCYCLAARSLETESQHVIEELENKGIIEGRKALSMIVGRDTEELSEEEVVKATVETVAENTADGVVGPLMYLALGGPVLGLVYKSINTMDSMVGYKNDRYRYFGTAGARLDDIFGFIPARISGLFMCVSAWILKKLGLAETDAKKAWKIFKRDRYNHKSPNSAHSESAVAGALGIQLGGSHLYGGKMVEKPTMGDDERPVKHEDVKTAHKLMYITAFLTLLTGVLAVFAVGCHKKK